MTKDKAGSGSDLSDWTVTTTGSTVACYCGFWIRVRGGEKVQRWAFKQLMKHQHRIVPPQRADTPGSDFVEWLKPK